MKNLRVKQYDGRNGPFIKWSVELTDTEAQWAERKELAQGGIVADNFATRGLLLELALDTNAGWTERECYVGVLTLALTELWD